MPDAPDLRYAIAWTGPGGETQRTSSAWTREQAEAILQAVRQIAALRGARSGFWLEVAPPRRSFAGWE